jgi:lactate permease
MFPFALLIGWLVLTRLVPPLERFLAEAGRIQPFAGAPAWSPLFHAGTRLIVGGVLTAILRGHAGASAAEARAAWKTGRLAVLSILTFSAMAEVLSGSGIAAGLAEGMFQGLGRASVIVTPLVSAAYGTLANSGNAANGLFMSSQVSLAIGAGLNVAAVVALQHAAALSLNMVSPVRMSIVCSLAGTPGREREAWRIMMPFAVATVLVLVLVAVIVATGRF